MVVGLYMLNMSFFVYVSLVFLHSIYVAYDSKLSKQRKYLDHNIKRLNCPVEGVTDRRLSVD